MDDQLYFIFNAGVVIILSVQKTLDLVLRTLEIHDVVRTLRLLDFVRFILYWYVERSHIRVTINL